MVLKCLLITNLLAYFKSLGVVLAISISKYLPVQLRIQADRPWKEDISHAYSCMTLAEFFWCGSSVLLPTSNANGQGDILNLELLLKQHNLFVRWAHSGLALPVIKHVIRQLDLCYTWKYPSWGAWASNQTSYSVNMNLRASYTGMSYAVNMAFTW